MLPNITNFCERYLKRREMYEMIINVSIQAGLLPYPGGMILDRGLLRCYLWQTVIYF